MIKFQIIIEKKGVQKKIKPFLGKTMSSLALVLSVLVLSTVIGLGIHLVFAAPFANPTADPPLENVEGPINVSDVDQMKKAKLQIESILQNSYNDVTGAWENTYNWQLVEDGTIGGNTLAIFGNAVANRVRAWDTLYSDNKIEAPNQNREHLESCLSAVSGDCQYSTPSTSIITCPEGKFLYKVQISRDGVSSQGWCAAPFVKTSSIIIPGGGIRPDRGGFQRGVGDGAFGDW
jgi:hypothetical protein